MRVVDPDGQVKTTPGLSYGMIVNYSGAEADLHPGWVLCDGTNGTPDLTDRFILGDTSIGTGSAAGTVSITAGLTHAGAAVAAHSNHVITQPSDHSAHSVGQAAAHDDHVVTQADDHSDHSANATHTHDSHTAANKTNGATTAIAGGFTHSADGAHTHDAHSSHTGAAVDSHSAHSGGDLDAHSAHSGAGLSAHSAHSVTQSSTHAIIKHYIIAKIMWIGAQ